MVPQKGYFTRLLEAAFLFALSAWLVRIGVGFIEDVWGWLILLVVIAGVIRILYLIRKHYKDTHF